MFNLFALLLGNMCANMSGKIVASVCFAISVLPAMLIL